MADDEKSIEKFGASEGIRTLDIHLGKVTLYQTELRSLPLRARLAYGPEPKMQAVFPLAQLALDMKPQRQ